MRGFKDDFYAWKETLTKDEQSLLLKQAQNEFDKKFRKSDEFTTDLPEEKLQSFGKALCLKCRVAELAFTPWSFGLFCFR